MPQASRARERLRSVANGQNQLPVSGQAKFGLRYAGDRFPVGTRQAEGQAGQSWVILAISLMAIGLVASAIGVVGLLIVGICHLLRAIPVPMLIAGLAHRLWAAL
jgi:hypothetical protein